MKDHRYSGSGGRRVFLSLGHHLEIFYVYGVLIVHWASIVVEYAQGVLDHIQDNSQLGESDGPR